MPADPTPNEVQAALIPDSSGSDKGPTLLGCANYWLWTDKMTPPQDIMPERVTKLGGLGASGALIAAGHLLWFPLAVAGYVLLFFWWNMVQAINTRKLKEYFHLRSPNTKFRDAGEQSPALRTDDQPHSL